MKILYLILSSVLCVSCNDNSNELHEMGVNEEFEYSRHDFHHEPKIVKGTLLSFVYDIPYFGACGVFPPLRIANKIFKSGGGDGGMGPGASWKPFRLNKKTYEMLFETILKTDPITLSNRSRYYHIKFIEDKSFDHIKEQFEWQKTTCDKHRDWYHEQNANIKSI